MARPVGLYSVVEESAMQGMISADSHVTEAPETYVNYIEPR